MAGLPIGRTVIQSVFIGSANQVPCFSSFTPRDLMVATPRGYSTDVRTGVRTARASGRGSMAGEVKSMRAVLAACFAAAWSGGAVAQGSGCASDTEIASALDNFHLAWSVSKSRAGAEGPPDTPVSPASFWKRVTDESHDRVDGLRSGSIGDNEDAHLSTRVTGPSTLSVLVEGRQSGAWRPFDVHRGGGE